MSIDNIILHIMLAGCIIGGIDKLLDNKYGVGEQFEEGFNAMGPIALAIVGIVSLAPVLGNLVKPVVSPILEILVQILPWRPLLSPMTWVAIPWPWHWLKERKQLFIQV